MPTSRRRSRTDDRSNELEAGRAQVAELRGERDLLRLRLKDIRDSEHSTLAEVFRLREMTFGRAERESPEVPLDYLFVVSCGRTGSTLVQGILNSTQGVVIRGENGGMLINLFDLHTAAQRPGRPLDGYPEELALREFRHLATDLLFRPDPGVHTVGFKEIKWPFDRITEYFSFLRGVFPGARFILSSRRLEDVAASGFWANRRNAMAELRVIDDRLRQTIADLGPAGFELRYEEMAEGPKGVRPLFDWLGFRYQPRILETVMARPHSYDNATDHASRGSGATTEPSDAPAAGEPSS
jgi:hypothetical protein